jgi:RNA polymerase sigma-70 factor (ECF subfamily)
MEGIVSVELTDGKISHFYAMRNPEKLGGVTVARDLSR